MKQLYYSLLLFGFSLFVSAQDMGGTPVEGLIPITRTDEPSQTSKSLNTTSEFNTMSEMQSMTTTTPTGSSTEVGITEGELAISPSGAATYNIPIQVPPGINGVIPQISLAYNSQGGNGIAGYGWNIAGISKITRIASTKYHDGEINGVDFDNLDRFALDGQRLIVKTGTYGANGTVYETENFSNTKITSYGVHPNGANYGPSYFVVEYPDGSKAYYGNSTDSRSIIEYGITYWENPQGVRISYIYNNINNSLSIDSINYGTLTDTSPINKIQFSYITANKSEQAYVGGQSIIQNKILYNIVITSNNIGYKRYQLAYNINTSGYQRLISVTEKNGDNNKNLNPTVFSYDDTSDLITNTNIPTSLNLGNINTLNAATVSGDFEGDEKMEFLIYPTIGTNSKTKYWLYTNIDSGNYTNIGVEHTVGAFEEIFSTTWLSWNNKLMPKQGWTVAKKTNTNYNFTVYSTGSESPIYYQYDKMANFPTQLVGVGVSNCGTVYEDRIFPKKILSGDFNGDGLTDVIAIDMDLEIIEKGVFCNSTVKSTISSKKAYYIDLKRDNSNFLTYSGELLTKITSSSKVEVVDVNGDGKSDFVVFENGKVTSYTLNSANQLVLLWDYTDVDISIDSNKTIVLGDYNGDGKTDFMIPKAYNSYDWYQYSSTGTTFNKHTSSNGITFLENNSTNTYSYLASDYDKDGKSDLILTKSTRNSGNTLGTLIVTCYKNTNGFFTSTNSVSGQTLSEPDINLNSLPVYLPTGKGIQTKEKPYNPTLEIAYLNNNRIFYFNSNKDNVKEQLLKSITTGYGVRESITYKPLTTDYDEDSGTIYNDSGYTEDYPLTDIQSASTVQVVTKVEKQSTTDYKKQLFTYYGAVTNLDGLGYLGFRATAKTNWFNDNYPIITTVSKFDINLRGANTENYTILGQYNASDYAAPSNFISKTVSTYDSSLGTNKVFNLKTTSSQQYNGLENTSTETSSIVYDVYNNPTHSKTEVKEGGTTQQTTITDLTYATPTSSPYVVGKPISKTQSITASGDTMTSEEQYTYDTGYLLTQVKKKGHNTDYITEDNIYDNFGNITKKTISASGVTPRVTNYEYDSSGRFLTKKIDVEGLITNYNYNTNNGVLNSETNPNGIITSYLYDTWFKTTNMSNNVGESKSFFYKTTDQKEIITTTNVNGDWNEETFDDLGRKIQSKIKSINNSRINLEYFSVDNQYDIYDRKIKVSEPYSGTTPTQWNENQYDDYGRPTQSISFTGKITTSNYSGLTTTINDGTITKTSTKNAIGNVITITDTPGGTINYTYFANGNLKSSDYNGVITTIEQDGWGRKTKLIDPSAGIYTYSYNLLGETTSETTPNGTTTYTLDSAGKLINKTIVGTNTNSETTYTYDTTTKLLTSSSFKDLLEGNAITSNAFEYDSYKRLYKTTETTPYATFVKQLTFDTLNRIDTETLSGTASGKTSSRTIKRAYKNGYTWQIVDNTTQQILWQTNNINARGQLTSAVLGNGIAITNTYDTYGYATQFKHDRTGTNPSNVMTLNTVFDQQRENLTSRTNNLFNWNESFTYDSLDRLTSFKNTAGLTETQSYDDRGRITQNAVGIYNYSNTSKAYQNTSVTVTPDALTHYQTNHEQNITYNVFKSPYQIEEVGKDKISFTYNDANSRSTMFYGSLDNNKLLRPLRKYYSVDGSMEIKHNITTGVIDFVTYIGGDGYTAPIVLKSDGTTQNYLYLQRDYQGSIVAITDATAQLLEKRLFDAWGNVLVQDGAGNTLSGLTILDRGYTGHEHLQSVGLINMNGRLYDAKLHRFLQPDNFVQEPSNTQNYNRYGYVLNNPLKYTDPSGEISFKSAGRWLSRNWKTIAVVAASVATAVIIAGSLGTATPLVAAAWAGAGAGLVGGSLGAALNGGNFGQIVMGGLKGAAFGAMTGYAGAYMSTAINAVGIIPGALSGASTSTALTAAVNLATGNDWNAGLGMSAVFGAVGGGVSGFSAAKASGSGIWFGTEVKPSATVIAKIDGYTKEAKAAYDKSLRSQANSTNTNDMASENVQKALKTLDEIKANGGTVKLNPMSPNQELNMTIYQGGQKLDLRIESHKLPLKFGGDGINPTRHMNIDIKGINLPNKGHVILNE